jgi:hypothetical protein
MPKSSEPLSREEREALFQQTFDEGEHTGLVVLDARKVRQLIYSVNAAEARVEGLERDLAPLRRFADSIEQAHRIHLSTGDYIPLGIAAQDALDKLQREENE